ncbi:MAG TPA: hypothetical protein VK943_20645 [Arenibaculum sp.]|nr:hypothetical protein [Arenibaculum sp.]
MRLLIYGMQSSGASTFAFLMAQRPDCLALVDVLNMYAAPRLETTAPALAKCVVTLAFPLDVHVERFRPDAAVLLLRRPHDNYSSLMSKPWRNHGGLIDEKFALLERVFDERGRFDAVVPYEDFVARRPWVFERMRDLGWPVEEGWFALPRTHNDLAGFVWEHEPSLFDRFELAFGNYHSGGISGRFERKPADPVIDAAVRRLCPRLCGFYDEYDRQHRSAAEAACA